MWLIDYGHTKSRLIAGKKTSVTTPWKIVDQRRLLPEYAVPTPSLFMCLRDIQYMTSDGKRIVLPIPLNLNTQTPLILKTNWLAELKQK